MTRDAVPDPAGDVASASIQAPRGLVRAALRVLGSGALPGAVLYGVLFALSVGFHASADYMGVEDKSVTDRVMGLFEAEIRAQQLGILAVYLALGAALGTLATAWLFLRDRAARPTPEARRSHVARRWGRQSALVVALVATQHLTLLLASMAAHPALYAHAGAQFAPMGWAFWLAVDGLPAFVPPLLPWVLPAFALAFLARTLWHMPPAFLAHRRAVPLAGASALLLGIGLALAFRPARLHHAPHPDRPNVIILAVDSMRADLLHTHPEAVPNLAALARRGTLFTRAIPTVPRTYPSWASMLTGRYPHGHGIRHMFPVPPHHANGLVVEHGLPELLGVRGYRTGVVSDFAGDVFRRGDWGFTSVDTADFTLKSNVAMAGVKLHLHLMPWLVEVAGGAFFREELLAFERLADPRWVEDSALDFIADDPDRPYLLVAFFSSGHFPFASPSPWWRRFGDPDYRGRSRFFKESFGQKLDGAAAETQHLRDLYLGGVAASDAAIGRLVARLDAAGAADDTIWIVTADHGENLYEHDLGMGHGDHLYGRTTLEVPLVIDTPTNAHRGEVVEAAVSLADLAPTVLGAMPTAPAMPPSPEVGAAPDTTRGIDLLAALDTRRPLAERPVFSEIDLWFFPPETDRLDHKRIVGVEGFAGFTFDPKTFAIFLEDRYQANATLAKHRMVLLGDRKLLYIPTRDGVRWELYAPLVDPGDRDDLAAREPATVARLQATFWSWVLQDPSVERVGDFVLPKSPGEASRTPTLHPGATSPATGQPAGEARP